MVWVWVCVVGGVCGWGGYGCGWCGWCGCTVMYSEFGRNCSILIQHTNLPFYFIASTKLGQLAPPTSVGTYMYL